MFFSIGILTPAAADVAPDYARVVELLETSETIVGEPIAYPDDGPAVVTSLIVTMMPGEETGWHEHDVPTYGYILEGQVTVDYGDEGDRTYQAGDAFMEAMRHRHNGVNDGDGPCRILVVFMGAQGESNVVLDR